MIFFYHNGTETTQILDEHGKELPLTREKSISFQFFLIASQYPDKTIFWLDESLKTQEKIIREKLLKTFTRNTIICSLGNIKNHFLYPEIGYVTDSPFAAISTNNIYPTWLMLGTAGIVHTSIINKFDRRDYQNTSLEFTLTSVAKIAQEKGLFCYHVPDDILTEPASKKCQNEFFDFVVQHYKRVWSFIALVLISKYNGVFPIIAFAKAQLKSKLKTGKTLNFQHRTKFSNYHLNYDVVIPTMGRKEYLKDVLLDLSNQSILPEKVIIVEQDLSLQGMSELDYISKQSWPYKIDHIIINKVGACNARNIALEKVSSDWILLFDDDVHINPDFINGAIKAIEDTNGLAFTFACLQKGEQEDRMWYLQWGNFGSGCSLVHKNIARNLRFDKTLEYGYGEDSDYGMQIRNGGFDIIYVPKVQIQHFKAPTGGFRLISKFPWSLELIQPKPSPFIMYQRKKNYTVEQLRGYKLVLFLKFYKTYGFKNPYTYYRYFKKAWKISEKWSEKLPLHG
ncbi:glycosyltransferase family 2 protein [Dokdonia sp. Hel_I_53]|uniref:glycosyltransferase family 2 protein n=1 Tax=Dokdonia sp. Hel_I_53 TaxID=1566287 RepID=UPI0011994FF0|nr:glycosyltransferase [Dokdonia sp. Hel_I_53]TVZ53400.1 GT2 family glycosyltransferase [Dokdonia sp. Hel_I_53]